VDSFLGVGRCEGFGVCFSSGINCMKGAEVESVEREQGKESNVSISSPIYSTTSSFKQFVASLFLALWRQLEEVQRERDLY